MVYDVRRASNDSQSYDSKYLEKKPCSKAFSDKEILMLSEYDFAKDKGIYDKEELKEPNYSKEKEPYSEDWKISLDEIYDLTDLVREVGAVVVYPDHIVIYDSYLE